MTEDKQKFESLDGLPEAPFSASFNMRSPDGVDVLFTVRSTGVNDGILRMGLTIKTLLKAEYTPLHKNTGGPASTEGDANAEGGATEQDYFGFKRLIEDDLVSYKLPFYLNDGNEAEHPRIIGGKNKRAIKMFEDAMRSAGIDPEKVPIGKLYKVNFTGTSRKGKEIPSMPGKHYVDWLSFKFVANGSSAEGNDRKQTAPDDDEGSGEIPF